MSIYIKGMEMPKSDDEKLIVYADGTVIYFDFHNFNTKSAKAIELPEHGRLGDLDALFDKAYTAYSVDMDEHEANQMMEMVSAAPTIIPADGREP